MLIVCEQAGFCSYIRRCLHIPLLLLKNAKISHLKALFSLATQTLKIYLTLFACYIAKCHQIYNF